MAHSRILGEVQILSDFRELSFLRPRVPCFIGIQGNQSLLFIIYHLKKYQVESLLVISVIALHKLNLTIYFK